MKLLLFIYVQRKMLSGCGLYNHNMGLLFLFIWCDMNMHSCVEISRKVATMVSTGLARDASESFSGRNHVGPETKIVLQIMVRVSDLILNPNLFVVPNTVMISEPGSL